MFLFVFWVTFFGIFVFNINFTFIFHQVSFFNNYLLDPKRPQLPEHPGNKQASGAPGVMRQDSGYNMPPGGAGGYQGMPQQQGMMGYNQPRPPMMYQGT